MHLRFSAFQAGGCLQGRWTIRSSESEAKKAKASFFNGRFKNRYFPFAHLSMSLLANFLPSASDSFLAPTDLTVALVRRSSYSFLGSTTYSLFSIFSVFIEVIFTLIYQKHQ